MRFRRGWVLLLCIGSALAQEQYPTPLIHTADNHPAERVLLLSVDGLHALDLERWVRAHPDSALAELSAQGVTYTQARLAANDEAAGMLALATGGTAISTRIPGTTFLDRAPISGEAACAWVDLRSPLPTGCGPLGALVGVNNIFELVRSGGGITAWAGDREGLVSLYRGRSQAGLSVDAVSPKNMSARAADEFRLEAVESWISGGSRNVPQLMGMNFAALAEAQRNDGYIDALGMMSPATVQALQGIDASIGTLIGSLKQRGMFASTWIVVTATYTAAPITASVARSIPLRSLTLAGGSDVTRISADGLVSIWLRDRSRVSAVATRYALARNRLGIAKIVTADELELVLTASGRRDSRSPDVVLEPMPGVVWGEKNTRRAEVNPNVALLVSGAQLTGRTDPTPVPTTQTAAMLLRALGMEKLTLEALHKEHSPALPGIF